MDLLRPSEVLTQIESVRKSLTAATIDNKRLEHTRGRLLPWVHTVSSRRGIGLDMLRHSITHELLASLETPPDSDPAAAGEVEGDPDADADESEPDHEPEPLPEPEPEPEPPRSRRARPIAK